MLSEERKQEVISLTRKLIGRPSPSGGEAGAAEELGKFLESHGQTEIRTDELGNFVCRIPGKREGEKTLFDGHIDTVPVPDPSKWHHDPYAGEIESGRLYGRGASDMKGAVAAYTAAAAFYAEDTGGDFSGEIYTDGIVHEELFEGVASRCVSASVKPDVVIIGEASGCDLKIGQRGRAEIVVETFGVPAHSANPEKGVNAVYGMCRAIGAIRGIQPEAHPFLGKGILELTDIKSSPYPGSSVVPAYCRATYDRRLLVGETKESVLGPIRERLEALEKEMPGLRTKVSFARAEKKCYTGNTIGDERFFPAWLFDENAEFNRKILAELRAEGFRPAVRSYSFCTNGSHYAGEAGIRTAGMGPSRENLAHTDDEYVETEELFKACECYMAIMRALNG